MPVIYKFPIRRGQSGAPASALSGAMYVNETDQIVYYGSGDDGSGNATSIIPYAGPGYTVNVSGNQSIGGVKTFTSSPIVPTPTQNTEVANKAYVDNAVSSAGSGDMLKAIYDTNNDGKVNAAEAADTVPWTGVTGKPTQFTPTAHAHVIGDVTGLQGALDLKAPLNSPNFSGNPTAPTQAADNNSTRIATTAFVKTAIDALIGGAGTALDTLQELAAAINNDPDVYNTLNNAIGGKLAKSANLSDLTNAAVARTNLGLASMATQAANAVAITGGTMSGVTLSNMVIDGGTW